MLLTNNQANRPNVYNEECPQTLNQYEYFARNDNYYVACKSCKLVF